MQPADRCVSHLRASVAVAVWLSLCGCGCRIVSGKDGAMQESDDKFFETIRMQKAGEEAAFLLSQSQNPVARAKARAARARSRVG